MKKVQLLFGVLVLSAFGLQAQKGDLTSQKVTKAKIFNELSESATAPAVFPFKSGGVPVGSCGNSFSFWLAGPHQVMYNKDINTTIFVHRCADVGTAGSGEMAFDYSTDGGDTWKSNVWISPNMAAQGDIAGGCRYPSATIHNPAGNTDPAQAHIVATGPCLTDQSGSQTWGYTFEMDATIEETPTVNDWYGSNFDNNDMYPYGMDIGSDGTVWTVTLDYNNTTKKYIGNVYLNKGVWNETESKIVWESGFYTWDALAHNNGGGAEDILIGDYSATVDPNDANHIYVVISACYTTDPNGDGVYTPHVYESTDGGVSFTELPIIDYSDAMFGTAWDTLIYKAEELESKMPMIPNADATVDAEGNIHMLCELKSKHPEWGSWIGNAYRIFYDDVVRPTSHFIDIHWNGSEWEWFYIAPELSENPKWGSAPNDIPLEKHPQIGRTPDGTQIFYSWNDSPTNGDSLNTTPNWFVYSWATNGNTFADLEGNPYPNGIINLTEGTAAANISFYTQFSPVTMVQQDDNTVELPCVIPLIDYNSGDPVNAVNMVYLNDFKVPYIGTVGITNAKTSKPDVMIFPNPVADIVGISKGNKVEVYNLLGDLIYEAQADNDAIQVNMTDYSAGTYIFKVYTNNGIVTKKVIRK